MLCIISSRSDKKLPNNVDTEGWILHITSSYPITFEELILTYLQFIYL